VTSRRPSVVVFDYGSGNLRSAQRALQRAGAAAEISADTDAALRADGLVVPGVGAFAACMSGLRAAGGDQVVVKRLAESRPVLGICVGMQILFAAGDEHGAKTEGVGCWPGVVQKLTAPVLPHMGWNVVARPPASRLLAGIDAKAMFYFVHSYAARQAPPARQTPPARPSGADAPVTGWTTHGEPFIALVEDGPLMATQFHPEKSSDAGAVLLANWLEALR
jgi:imidazole glycerol-phosphate synthase subunit HisH